MTLLPLAELIESMVASREDKIHEATIKRRAINSKNCPQKQSANSNKKNNHNNQTNNLDTIQELASKSSASVNTMPSTTYSANTKGRVRSKKGVKP